MAALTVIRAGMWVVVQGRVGLVTAATPAGVGVDICHPYYGVTLGTLKDVPYEAIRQAKWRNIPACRRPAIAGNERWLVDRGYLTEADVLVMQSPRPLPTAVVQFERGEG